jgi:hypothetical protein
MFRERLSELYKNLENLGDPLTGISDRIDFEKIRPILLDLYENDSEKGGRPNYDPILMVKILLLQQWYNLSDPQIEREINDRISFMSFSVSLRNSRTGTPSGISGKGYPEQERIVLYSII